MRRRLLLLLVLFVAGCVQPPPFSPADIQAKRFEALPDKAVIYIVRDSPDASDDGASISLDDSAVITTFPGTYYRWEVAPGPHRIAGFAADSSRFELTAEAGRVYFVLQRMWPFMMQPLSHFQLLAEPHGRAAVARSELLGGR
jgi:hypothetical protein